MMIVASHDAVTRSLTRMGKFSHGYVDKVPCKCVTFTLTFDCCCLFSILTEKFSDINLAFNVSESGL